MPGVLATSVPLAVVLFVQLTGVLLREEFMPWAPVATPLVIPTPDDPALPLVPALPPVPVPVPVLPPVPVLLPVLPLAPLLVALLPIAPSLFMPVELQPASANAMTLPRTRLVIAVFIIAPVSLICAHDLSIYCTHL
jgi:hypothetical protein